MPEDNYTNFPQLVEYARLRAVNSAKRNGHQEFAYWHGIMRWAQDGAKRDYDILEELNASIAFLEYRHDPLIAPVTIADMADTYAKAVHLRKMLKNRGVSVPRLSLNWLREEAAEIVPVYSHIEQPDDPVLICDICGGCINAGECHCDERSYSAQ